MTPIGWGEKPTCDTSGASGRWIGWRWYLTDYGGDGRESKVHYTCAYDPGITRVMTCGWSVGGTWAGPARLTSELAGQRRTLPEQLTPFARGQHTEAACTASFVATLSSPTNGWGYFELIARGTQASCTFTEYDDGSERFRGCTAPYSLTPNTYRGTKACSVEDYTRWIPGLAFDTTDCGQDTSTFSCGTAVNVEPSIVTSDGSLAGAGWSSVTPGQTWTGADGHRYTGTDLHGANLMALGAVPTRVIWPTPQIEGMTDIRNIQATLRYTKGGTPNPGLGISDNGQTFRVGDRTNHVNEPSVGWGGQSQTQGQAAWDLAFWTTTRFMAVAPQDPEPYVFTPVWQFTGDVQVHGTEVYAINLRTGELLTRPVTYTLNDVKGECSGQPTYVNVGRGRNV